MWTEIARFHLKGLQIFELLRVNKCVAEIEFFTWSEKTMSNFSEHEGSLQSNGGLADAHLSKVESGAKVCRLYMSHQILIRV